MAEWMFPNAIAESVKLSARLRGQHANRLEIRDAGDRWPPFERVSPRERCPGSAFLTIHTGQLVKQASGRSFWDPFCSSCGLLVDGRREAGT